MIDPSPLWDFDDPAGSELRFLEAAEACSDSDDRALLLTQVARALGLQGRYDEGRAMLDSDLGGHPEVMARTWLEHGRLSRSAGDVVRAREEFDIAVDLASNAGLDLVQVDALHMVALVADPEDQVAINQRALRIALDSADPRARNWDASLLNNIGMVHSDAGDLVSALAAFEAAEGARRRIGDDSRTRVARWMVAWTLRRLDRTDEALVVQRELKAELDAVGEVDPYVDEELALLSDGA
jgi:tetratricopeptide (TPR) repeat protein